MQSPRQLNLVTSFQCSRHHRHTHGGEHIQFFCLLQQIEKKIWPAFLAYIKHDRTLALSGILHCTSVICFTIFVRRLIYVGSTQTALWKSMESYGISEKMSDKTYQVIPQQPRVRNHPWQQILWLVPSRFIGQRTSAGRPAGESRYPESLHSSAARK